MEKQDKQKVKKEHYVPQCYLNMFANKIGKKYKFFVFDKYKNEVRFGNVEDYASEHFFYDVSFKKILEMEMAENHNFEIPLKQKQLADKVEEQYLEHFFVDMLKVYVIPK